MPSSAPWDTGKAAAAAALRFVTAGNCAMPEAAMLSATCCAWPYFDDYFKISPRRVQKQAV